MFVTIQDFTSDPYAIPNLDASENSFLDFADNHEREVLGKMLGPLLFNELTAGLAVVSPAVIDPKWIALRDGSTYVSGSTYYFPGFKKILVPYIYAMWVIHKNEELSGNGTVRPSSENSVRVSPDLKIIRAYNDFVRHVIPYRNNYHSYHYMPVTYFKSLYDFVNAQPLAYTNFNFGYFDLRPINQFGL